MEKKTEIKKDKLSIPVNKCSSSSEEKSKPSFFQFKSSSSPRSRSSSNESIKSPKKLTRKHSAPTAENTVSRAASVEFIDETIFNLDLETIIDAENDSTIYGRTLAYCGDKFLAQQKMIGKYHDAQELTTSQYISYKSCPLNTIQIEKITIIKALIAILNNAYHLVKRSTKDHEDISIEILYITELSMCSSHEKWKGMLADMAKTNRFAPCKEDIKPAAYTACLWEGLELGIMIQKTDLQKYKELIKALVTAMENLFILDDKVKLSISSSNTNTKEIAYITLNHLDALCQAHLKRELRKQFITNYLEEHQSQDLHFTSLHDLFSSIHAKKEDINPESLPYEMVGLILKRAYPDQYQHFIKNLPDQVNTYQLFKKST